MWTFFSQILFLDLESLSGCLYLFLSVLLDPSWNTPAGEPLTSCLPSSNKSIICLLWLSTSLQSAVTTCCFFLVRITKPPWAISLVTQKKGGTQRANTTTHSGRSFTDQEHIPSSHHTYSSTALLDSETYVVPGKEMGVAFKRKSGVTIERTMMFHVNNLWPTSFHSFICSFIPKTFIECFLSMRHYLVLEKLRWVILSFLGAGDIIVYSENPGASSKNL